MPHPIILRALDGANPLGMLATLGALRVATLADPDATLHWEDHGGWRGVLTTAASAEDFVAAAIAELHRHAGREARTARRETLQKELAKIDKEIAKLGKEASATGRKAPPPGRLSELRTRLDQLSTRAARLREALADLDAPPTRPPLALIRDHDLVAVARANFRTPAAALLQQPTPPNVPTDADYYAALGCDAILKEKKGVGPAVEPTPFSFSNGGSGKCLLKDFRNAAAATTRHGLREILAGRLRREDPITSLLWDPADQQSYALRWADPGDRTQSPPAANAAANALAFLGLTFLPALPAGTRLTAVGMDPRARQWTWPLWAPALTAPEVAALLALAQPDQLTPRQRQQYGLVDLRSSRRFFLNKRPFFSPSRAVPPR